MLADSTLHALDKHAEFYRRAAAFEGRPRERMVALGEADELFFRLFPHHYRALQLVRVASQLGRAIHRRQDSLRRCESRTVALLSNVVHDALRARDLILAGSQRPEEIAFTVWALVFGMRALLNTAVATAQLGIDDGRRVVRDSGTLLLDALGWRPLSDEWDYACTRRRIRGELFAAEWQNTPAA